MKTKIIIGILICSLFLVKTYSQTESETILLGGNASAAINFGGGTTFGIGFAPDIGYFVVDNIAIGARVPLSLTIGEEYRMICYGIAPFVRFYFQEMGDMLVFVTANLGIDGVSSKIAGISDSDTGFIGGAGIGVTHMLTDNIGVECIFGYSFQKYKNVDLQSRIGIDAGFQIYYKL